MKLSEAQLERWGHRIGREVGVPVFIGLRGSLGSGKSVFARAVARGAGVEGPLPSPTFNVMFRYVSPRRGPVTHVDLYRLSSPDELGEIGWADVLAEDGIVLVEWPERAGDAVPDDRWEVELTIPSDDPDLRIVAATRIGEPTQLPGFPVSVE